MTSSAPSLATEVSAVGNYPANRFNQRERKLLQSVKTYVDTLFVPDSVITTQGDLILGNVSGAPARLAKGTSGLPLVAGASTVSYAALDNSGISASAAIAFSKLAALTSAQILVGNGSNVATAVAVTGDITLSNAGVTAIGAGKVLLAMLGTGITPSHIVKFAGSYNTVGGSATEAQTLSGVLSTDTVVATLKTKGATPRTILTTAPTNNTITYVFSADPSNDHVISYVVFRVAT